MNQHPFCYWQKLFCFCLLLCIGYNVSAQIFPPKNYPQGYFTWPIGAKIALAANFGELRPNHYHMGLDCKSDQSENKLIYAAAEGYIAKVKIEPSGFGRAIYINHPNGLTTLYAHLNDFYPELEKYVKEQQYKLESWKVFIDIPANLFPVRKGQFIAYSGNTGGSQGPHLHFEIRDTKTDKVLNPLLFDFPVGDNIAPDILRLAVYDRSIGIYEQSPKLYPVKKSGGVYTIAPLTVGTDKVSFAITAYDRYSGSTNQNGIYESILYDNDEPVVGFQLDSISYDETRYLNAHIDYKLKMNGGPYVQHLSRLPGYPIGVYKEVNGNGVIDLSDSEIHHIKILVKDVNGNTSTLKFDVKRGWAKSNQSANALYQSKEFHPGFINVYENEDIHFYMPENCLYDSIRFRLNEIAATAPNTASPLFQLQYGFVPVHDTFPVTIRSNSTAKDKIVMKRYWGSKDSYQKAEYDNGWYKAGFRDFGYYQLLIDLTAPVISPVGFRDGMNCSGLSRIAFTVTDNSEELTFRAELDGKWLRFTNDKGKTFIYKFDEHCPPGKHQLKIRAEDQVGNVTEKIYNFTR